MRTKKTSDKRQRIIDAAMKLVSERGYHGATTALIAKDAGVSQGIIFHYFKNKEDLFLSLLKEKSNMFREALKENVSGERDAIKKLEIAIRTYCRLVVQQKESFEVLIRQTRGSGLNARKIDELQMMESIEVVGEILKGGIEQGTIREIDVETATICLFGMMDHIILRWMIYSNNSSLEEYGMAALDIFLRGVAKGSN